MDAIRLKSQKLVRIVAQSVPSVTLKNDFGFAK
jgi:hypothetical protein